MPSEHQRQLGLPEGLSGETPVWVVRYTGEVFTDYETYLQQLTHYRQRIWTCKYTGASGLTYEEAIISEQRVGRVVEQFPSLYEGEAIRLVHHSVETTEQLCSTILTHLASHFVEGEELLGSKEDGGVAQCIVREVQLPQRAPGSGKQNGAAAAGDDSDATEDEKEEGQGDEQEGQLPSVDPESIVYVVEWVGEPGQQASLRRTQAQRPEGSPLAALTLPLLQQWVETVATAEPVAGVAGISCLWRVANYWRQRYGLPEQLPPEMAERLRPARQKALHKVPSVQQAVAAASDDEAGRAEEDEVEEYDPAEEEAELYQEAAAASDFSDDDYRPMQPNVEARFKPMPARGRGRGRGRGRWGGRGAGAYGYQGEANPAAAAFAAAAVSMAGGSFGPGQSLSRSISETGQVDGGELLLEAQRQDARQLAAAAVKPKPDRNNFKCPKCHRVAHPEQSPLLLCDTCPRSFHQACLGLSSAQLPSGDWCCPKCVNSTQAALRRVMDTESRKQAASERAAARERAAEEKAAKRGALWDVGGRKPDDWDVLMEEKENVNRLEIRLRELQELLARIQQQAAADGVGPGAPQPPPAFSAAEADDLHMRIGEASEALTKLRAMVEGPPQQYQELVSGQHAQAVLFQGLAATEFLKLYGDACEARAMGLQELYISLAWPLDNPELAKLLQQLLLCCLLELINHEPPERGRGKRWARVLTDSTWPEVCRRYLLFTRAGKAKLTSEDISDVMGLEDDAAALLLAHTLESTPWHRLPATALLRLVNILCYDIAQGFALRNEINTRLQNITKITTERYREHAAERKAKREGDWGPAFAKKRGGRGGGRKGGKQSEPTEEELQAMAEEVEAEAMEEEGDNEASRFRLQRELQYDARLEATAMRTEPLGLDRHCRRYWWLHSDPGFLFVEDADGQRISAITSKEQLDEVMSRLNRRGPRERSLHHAIRKKYGAICARLALQSKGVYQVEGIPRPAPLGAAQPPVEDLEARLAAGAVEETREKLDAFLAETQRVGVELEGGASVQEWRDRLAACGDATALCSFMLQLETVYCHAGEGLPKDADDATMAALLGEAAPPGAGKAEDEADDAQGGNNSAAAAAPAVKAEPDGLEGAAPMDVDGAAAGGAEQQPKEEQGASGEQQQQQGAGAAGGHLLHASGSSAALFKEESTADEQQQLQERQAAATQPPAAQHQREQAAGLPPKPAGGAAALKPPLHPSVAKLAKADSLQPSSAGVSQSGAEAGGTETEAGTTVDQQAQPLRPVCINDDMDDSDAEHAYLREKRMRRPARLWRTARERAVWLRMVRGVRSADQAAYCAYIMCDRAGPMLQRVVQLAEELAKWEAEEKERQRLEGLRAARQQTGTPSLRPLMIRTGKAKTDDGVRIVLKAMGKEPFGGARTSNMETIASEEQVAECRWGYQCSVCLLAGDLLCCEHPEGCVVSVHPECTGRPFPSGPYICMNHDSRELKTRIRRRASSALAAQDDSEATADEEEEEEEGEDGEEAGGGKRGKAADADSEATVSEETHSVDSSATEDEGTTSRRKRKR